MNRRQMLLASAAGLVGWPTLARGSAPLTPNKLKKYDWFTQKQLLHLFGQLDGQTTRETVDMVALKCWNDDILKPHEALYLAIMRMTNIMHRKTLDSQSPFWLVVSPEMCMKTPDVWYQYLFSDYSTPGEMGGIYIRRPWREKIQQEVTPGVYNIGCLNNKWQFYVCKGFPDNKVMLGMGYREVIRHRYDGTTATIDLGDGKMHEYPNVVAYQGKPTKHNYSVITLDYGK